MQLCKSYSSEIKYYKKTNKMKIYTQNEVNNIKLAFFLFGISIILFYTVIFIGLQSTIPYNLCVIPQEVHQVAVGYDENGTQIVIGTQEDIARGKLPDAEKRIIYIINAGEK